MALLLNPLFDQPNDHQPTTAVFPILDCPNNFVPLDIIRQIAVVLSAPPTAPFDIDVNLSAVPADAICPPVTLTDPPALPIDIPNIQADPPALPIDIPNPPGPPVVLPTDIPNILSTPPVPAVDISNPLSGPPALPTDIPIELSRTPEPALPIDVSLADPPAPLLVAPIAGTTPIPLQDIVRSDPAGEAGYPETNGNRFHGGFLDPRDDINLISNLAVRAQMVVDAVRDGSLLEDPLNLIKLGRQLSVSGLGASIGFGPLRLPIPFLDNETHEEKVRNQGQGPTDQAKLTIEAIELNNQYSPGAPYNNAQNAGGSGDGRPLFDIKELNDTSFTLDNNAFFNLKKKKILSQRVPKTRPVRNIVGTAATFFGSGLSPGGQIPASFSKDRSDGSIITTNSSQSPHEIITDNESYVPLSFTDVRPLNDGGSFRTVYFRPFITSLTEDFSPEWDKKTLYGRTDQVVTYMSTVRTIFIGFELHAFYPDDLQVIYNKLKWLSALVYPEYDNELLLKSGPVCKMRVGDVISGRNKQGLTGIIDSLSFDYTDSIWEIDEGSKAPRSVKVSISFQAIHEVPIGRNSIGDFGGLSVTPSSLKETRVPGADHNWGSSQVVKTQIDHDLSVNGSFFRGIGNR